MKRLLVFILALPLSMNAHATLDPQLPRGEQIVSLPVPGRPAEICVIPSHFGDARYSSKDLEKEQSLCGLNVYTSAAVCPKLTSTNPGLLFHSLPKGSTPGEVEALHCEGPSVKKLAKYKLSSSCSYTPSILAYYHLSRALGGIGQVPPAVLRTFDLPRHIQLGQLALSKADPTTLIFQTWKSLMSSLEAGANSTRKDLLLTKDFNQSYGALQENPRGEEFYQEFFIAGKDNMARAIGFRDRAPVALLLKDSRAVSEFVPRTITPENVQKIVAMKDASDMIVLDTLLSQQDRFGNIDYKEESISLDPANPAATVTVKKMLLSDNDCGIVKDNVAKATGLLGIVKHMDADTYKRLLTLEAGIDSANAAPFFLNNLVFTANDLAGFKKNLKELVAGLKASCKAGDLKLDLNLQNHFSQAGLQSSTCEL